MSLSNSFSPRICRVSSVSTKPGETAFTKILSDITKLIEYTGVKDLIYIAIDGIAPASKMKQQRQRRYKSALERKYSSDHSWNTNAISPGTYFMSKLNLSLKAFIKTLKIKTQFMIHLRVSQLKGKIVH